jgi:hypothetical protein
MGDCWNIFSSICKNEPSTLKPPVNTNQNHPTAAPKRFCGERYATQTKNE